MWSYCEFYEATWMRSSREYNTWWFVLLHRSIYFDYLFVLKNSNFPHMDSCVASLFFCLPIMEENVFYIHVLPIVLACRGLTNTCITVENSNVWVSSELVTITSTSPNIILIYISNFMSPYLTNYHQHGYISISGCPFFFKFTGPW